MDHLSNERPTKTCQWLDGEPSERNFCGKPVIPGTSWCAQHHKRVFVQQGGPKKEAELLS